MTEPNQSRQSLALSSMKDGSIMALVKAGSGDALGELFTRYEKRLLRACRRQLPFAPDLAEEALQEVFIRVGKSASTFEEDRSVSPWLYRIANNACNDIYRHWRTRREIGEHRLGSSAGENPLCNTSCPRNPRLDELVREERRAALWSAIDALGPEHRRVVELFLREMSYEEIARELGCPIGTVKSRLNALRLRLKEFLENSAGGHLMSP